MSTEFVWCPNSVNRDPDFIPVDPNNPTNDIKLPANLSINRLSTKSLELATFEIPRTQSLIEQPWSVLSFSNDIRIQNSSATDLYFISIQTNDYTYTVELPDRLY